MALQQTHSVQLASGQQATGASSAVNCKGYTMAMIECSGISSDTVLLQARIDQGQGWHTFGITNVTTTDGAVSASMIADGLYRVNLAGVAAIRSNVSVYGSGNLNISVRLTDQ